MSKNYQSNEIDTSRLSVPETVNVALAEIAEDMREGLLALAVGTGLQVMNVIMEQDVTAVCGPKGRHDPERTATRHGHGGGSVTLCGRRVAVTRLRMRATDGSGELPVPAYELFSDTEILGRMALDRMLAGISTRRYPVALERTHPGAAASLREGMDETLTVLRLDIPPTLARTFRSTNAVESMISICRDHSSNVKRWREGQMALRWCAAGMIEAGKQFRCVNGHMHLRSLRDTLDRVTQPVGATSHTERVEAA